MHRLATLLAVMRKDCRDLLKNRALLISMLAPILVAAAFMKVVEHSGAPTVHLILVGPVEGRLKTALTLSGIFEVRQLDSMEEARSLVEAGKADVALSLPAGFERSLRGGERPLVGLVARQDASPAVLAAVNALGEILRIYAGQLPPVKVDMQLLGAEEKVVRMGGLLCGWVLFALLMGFTVVAASLVEERERGTLRAILVTPASLGAVLLGKGLFGWILCFGAALAILWLSGLVAGSWLAVLSLVACGAAFVVGLGLCMGALFPNMAAANAGLSVIFLLLFAPVFLVEGVPRVAALVHLLPSWTLMDGLRRALVERASAASLQLSAVILLAWGTAAATTSFYAIDGQRKY